LFVFFVICFLSWLLFVVVIVVVGIVVIVVADWGFGCFLSRSGGE
jgi:hypothetical protein